MKIVLTGGGTGGHFYPIIAVAQELNRIADEQKLVQLELYFMSDAPYDARLLFENGLTFKKVEAGKRRTYRSFKNILDLFKTASGVLRAIFRMFLLYPDVVFSKGGYASFPPLLAARLFRIPVIIHESDSVPGRVNRWAGKFAERIAIAFPEAATYFPREKTALIGVPIRHEMQTPVRVGAHEFLHLEPNVPVIMVVGGSQGAQRINDAILDSLLRLVDRYQIIHQAGVRNVEEVRVRADVILMKHPHKNRYKLFDFLNETALRMVAGVSELAVARAGATTIFELAVWQIPTILIPISESVGDHQRTNAYSYARAGAAIVIEEKTLASSVLVSEIDRVMASKEGRVRMQEAAKQFALPDAARLIAQEIIAIGLTHE